MATRKTPAPATPALASQDQMRDAVVERIEEARLRYEAAWKAFLDCPFWETNLSRWTAKQQAELDRLGDAAHEAFWAWKA